MGCCGGLGDSDWVASFGFAPFAELGRLRPANAKCWLWWAWRQRQGGFVWVYPLRRARGAQTGQRQTVGVGGFGLRCTTRMGLPCSGGQPTGPESKKPTRMSGLFSFIGSLAVHYSRMATATLPSSQLRFTSEFGMGSGGSTALLPPGKNGLSL